MKNFLRKVLVTTIATVLAIPISALVGFATAEKAHAAVNVIKEGFDLAPAAPAGWSFQGITDSYTSDTFSGASVPAVKFDDSGDSVTTPVVADASQLAFWIKGTSNMQGSSLLVEGRLHGVWETAVNIVDIPTVGTTYAAILVPGVDQIRFTYTKSAGNVALDDVEINVPSKAVLTGTPSAVSNQDSSNITVTGEGVVNYKYSLDGSAYSASAPITQPLSLVNLTEGNHTLKVVGQDSDGYWQDSSIATTYSWTVDTTKPVLTLIGSAAINIDQYSHYVDAGATAIDGHDGDLTAKVVATGAVDTTVSGLQIVHYNVTDAAGNTAVTVSRAVTVVAANLVNQNLSNQTVAIAAGNSNGTVINIAKDLTGESLDLSALTLTPSATATTVTTEHQINVNLSTVIGQVQVSIPGGTVISGSTGWDGKLNLPEVTTNPTLSTLAGSDYIVSDGTTIKLGLDSAGLTFSQPIQIVMTGLGGKKVGYIDATGKFTEITTFCDNALAPTNISGNGECKVNTNSGADLAVWTKHLTKFVAYSAEQVTAPVFTAGGVEKNGSRYIDVAWTGTGGGVDYEVRINDVVVATVSASADLAGVTYSKEFGPYGYGSYSVKVRAVKNSVYSNTTAKDVTFQVAAPSVSSVGTTSSGTSLVAKASAKSTTVAPAPETAVATPSDSQGIIKGSNTTSETTETTNWTPWIILFTLIVLAGAVTGGYFYWFAGKDEVEKPVKAAAKSTEKAKVVVREKSGAKKKTTKKPNRW